ncbi:MAG: T9SS type A sorting domain-containing protein [Bacteroidetes bacterium]|nr:T9SS type A sorting domain-containing protein [Bacteroidota bacterium]
MKLKIVLATIWIFGAGLYGISQPLTKCFEIERILVDACSSVEGENEMVYFQVGPAPLNTSNLSVEWATTANPWLSVCQNGQTNIKTDSLNNSIMSCGRLIQPIGGVLPANARVILITSTNVSALANSFANLSDTLYVIYQCFGNTQGHFGNSGSAGIKTLIMKFANGGCADTVKYQPSSLVNINGATGGSSTLQDGSSVAFTWDGIATYYNNGCVAPFIPSFVDAGPDTSVCVGTPIQLHGMNEGVSGYSWFSSQGTFDTSTILTPVFTPQTGISSFVQVILSGFTACDTIYDTLLVNLSSGSAPLLTIDKPLICASDSAQICAPSGFASYLWNNGKTTACFQTNLAGNYYVQVTDGGGCDGTSQPVALNVRPQPSVSIIRQGDTLSSYGAVAYQWLLNNQEISGATAAVYIARQSGLYSVEITDNFGCKATSTGIDIFISGVKEIDYTGFVHVYPNPTNDWLNVSLVNNADTRTYFNLYDALGQKMLHRQLSESSARLSISQLSKGTYFWDIEQGENRMARGKVLIR